MSVFRCRGCESTDLREVIDLGEMPLAGGFLPDTTTIANEKRYSLKTHVCGACALIQIVDPVDPAILFTDYAFSSSTVPALVSHFEQYAGWLDERYHPRSVAEIGCNDGILLKPLSARGIRSVGVDISENITEMARNQGLDVVTAYFDPPTAHALRDRLGPVDVVTGSNCFPHNADPGAILDATKFLLGRDGTLVLEVMYAGDLLEQLQWDTLYHEHLTFYSLGTLSILLQRYGFHVRHAERLPMHGGSLRVAAALTSAEPSPEMQAIQAYEGRTGLNRAETWLSFGARCQRKIEIVGGVFAELARNKRLWAYGAAGKSTMWLNACRMTYLEAMVDASPLRAGKLMPGVHTPIVFPDELKKDPPDFVFITAWNYAASIASKEQWFRGVWATPLPDLRFF
jgi:novobiocin biosynthesis protein NovU/D-mycarose 3-C-methyltransferase